MLDLGLEHLGVDVGAAGAGVEAVLKACGESARFRLAGFSFFPAHDRLSLQHFLGSRTRRPGVQRTKQPYWSQRTRMLLVGPLRQATVLSLLRLFLDGLSRLPPIRLKSDAELGNQRTPEASCTLNGPAARPDDGKAAPSSDSNPLAIIVSPDSGTQLRVESPAGIEGTTFTTSNASVTQGHVGQEGCSPPYESTSTQAASPPVSAPIRPSSPTPVSGDIILPLMIFAVVKANPSHFVSHLLYTQRFRNQRIGGEESYCLVNLMAVADFLENVDLKALGLGESEKKVMRFVMRFRWPPDLTLSRLAPPI